MRIEEFTAKLILCAVNEANLSVNGQLLGLFSKNKNNGENDYLTFIFT